MQLAENNLKMFSNFDECIREKGRECMGSYCSTALNIHSQNRLVVISQKDKIIGDTTGLRSGQSGHGLT